MLKHAVQDRVHPKVWVCDMETWRMTSVDARFRSNNVKMERANRDPGQSSLIGFCGSQGKQLDSWEPDSVSFPLSKSDIIRYFYTKVDCRVDV